MATAKDPICGKEVDTLRARAVGIFGGVTYYFCSAECKAQFKDPRKTPRPEPAPEKKHKDPSPAPSPAKEERVESPNLPAAAEPIEAASPSEELEPAGHQGGWRGWAVVVALVAVLVIVAAVLSLP
jgi:Cu+-exporting ATPase